MAFKNISDQILDVEDKLKSKQRELDNLTIKVEDYCKMDASLKEASAEAVLLKEKTDKEIVELKNKKEELTREVAVLVEEIKILKEKKKNEISSLDFEIDLKKEQLLKQAELLEKLFQDENESIKNAKEKKEEAVSLETEIESLKKQKEDDTKKTEEQLYNNSKKINVSNKEIARLEEKKEALIKSIEDDNIILHAQNKMKEEINFLELSKKALTIETGKLNASFESEKAKIDNYKKKAEEEISKKDQELNLKSGEISIREKKVEEVKLYLQNVVPKLAAIDSKSLFKIDLSKI